jgi:hypothetical protein
MKNRVIRRSGDPVIGEAKKKRQSRNSKNKYHHGDTEAARRKLRIETAKQDLQRRGKEEAEEMNEEGKIAGEKARQQQNQEENRREQRKKKKIAASRKDFDQTAVQSNGVSTGI